MIVLLILMKMIYIIILLILKKFLFCIQNHIVNILLGLFYDYNNGDRTKNYRKRETLKLFKKNDNKNNIKKDVLTILYHLLALLKQNFKNLSKVRNTTIIIIFIVIIFFFFDFFYFI